jgi:heme a synthase
VQWTHRVIGTVLLISAIVLVTRVLRSRAGATSRRLAVVLLSLVSMQYLLGILTLVHLVPVSLGVIHQAVALVIFGAWLWWLHHVRHASPGFSA